MRMGLGQEVGARSINNALCLIKTSRISGGVK